MEEKEPTHIDNLRGKYWLLNGDVVCDNISFNSIRDAEIWGQWANFWGENPFKVIHSPSVKAYPRPFSNK